MILKTPPLADVETLGELLARLGNIPAERVRYWPFPGTATEADLLALERGCELVDGTLVEKPMGFFESRLAAIIGHFIELFLDEHDLGFTTGEQDPYRILPRIVRMPDVAFVSWQQLPDRKPRQRGIARLVPDLAIEVLSLGNTRAEMLRKREEYFRAGTKLVWEINPVRKTAAAYTAPRRFTRVDAGGVLDGADVLPGFQLSLRQLFARARMSAPGGRS